MRDITVGPLSHLVLLGSSPLFSDISTWCNENGVKLSIITSEDQRPQLDPGLDCHVTLKIDTEEVHQILAIAPAAETLAISFGARWIFTAQHIEGLFHGNLLNIHGTRLPFDRGGGGFSWRIMRNDRIGSLLIHKIDEGVDTGPIVAHETYVIPKHFTLPVEIEADFYSRLSRFILALLEPVVHSARKMELLHQNEELSSYFPRLSTTLNGWIDWNLTAEELERFITAFDDPYPGASTLWRGAVCKIKGVQVHGGEIQSHPFQAGLIFRKGKNWILCSTRCGKSLLIENVHDEQGADIMDNLKAGDRLATPPEKLHEARTKRVEYTARGLKT